MKKLHTIELIIFLILITIFAFFGVKAFKHTFDIGTTYHIMFKDIDSIVIGSPVRILGVDVGHVTKIQNDIDKIYVDFVINDGNIKLPNGTKATIEFFGIAGSRSIELTPPNSQTNADGIIVSEPIRIGDAFDIMQNFMEASMNTLSGLSEFAQGRSQDDVEKITKNILTTTQETDDKIVNLASTIEQGGAKVHKSFAGTTKGLTRVYNEVDALNISENFNLAKYSINLTKRTLIQFHRNMKSFNKKFKNSTQIAEFSEKSSQIVENIAPQILNLHEAFEGLDNSMMQLNKSLSQENLDKAFDKFEQIRILTENIENQI